MLEETSLKHNDFEFYSILISEIKDRIKLT